MTTVRQDKLFADALIKTIVAAIRGEDGILLETAIEWMQENLSPESVFNESELESWAEENGYVKGG